MKDKKIKLLMFRTLDFAKATLLWIGSVKSE
jgi:hypothetical protein